MTIFVDTSAIYAFMDTSDTCHAKSKKQFESLFSSGTSLLTTNYVVLESSALVQKRLGGKALRALFEDMIPMFEVRWVNMETHSAAVASLVAASKQRPSLVDMTSFEMMRRMGIRDVFAFDRHFKDQGFSCMP